MSADDRSSLSTAQIAMLRRAAANPDGQAALRRGQHSTAHVLARKGLVDGPTVSDPNSGSPAWVVITRAGREALRQIDASGSMASPGLRSSASDDQDRPPGHCHIPNCVACAPLRRVLRDLIHDIETYGEPRRHRHALENARALMEDS